MKRFIGIVMLALAGCGGGGGGGTATTPSGDPAGTVAPEPATQAPAASARSDLTLTPGSFSRSLYLGDSETVTVVAQLTAGADTKLLNSVRSVQILDPQGVTTGSAQLTQDALSPGRYTFLTSLSPKLAAGTYEGMLTARLCLSTTDGCAAQAAAPLELPYRVVVRSGTNLTPRTPVAGAHDWEAYQGDQAHTGFVPIDLDPTRFVQRFRWHPPGTNQLDQFTVAGSTAAVVYQDGNGRYTLHAIGEATGTTTWTHVNPMAPRAIAAEGRIYVPTPSAGNQFSPGAVVGLDRQSGAQVSSVPVPASLSLTGLGAVENGTAYWSNKLDLTSGQYTAVAGGPDSAMGRVTVAGANWYVYGSGGSKQGLFEIEKATARVLSIDPSFVPTIFTAEQTALHRCGPSLLLVAGGSDLIAYDVSTHSVKWTVNQRHGVGLACNQTSFFVNNRGFVEQRSLADGKLEWESADVYQQPVDFAPYDIGGNLVLTNRHLFFATYNRLYAMDLATRKIVWSTRAPTITGTLALSQTGVLYALGVGGVAGLYAFNLN